MYKGTKILIASIPSTFYTKYFPLFFRCGTILLTFVLISGRRGELWSVGSTARSIARVDHVHARSTRSLIRHVRNWKFK